MEDSEVLVTPLSYEVEEAERKGQQVANFSAENLKRLGAKSIYKDVLYIKITNPDCRDYKSRVATEEDKRIFADAWHNYKMETENKGMDLRLLPGMTASTVKELYQLKITTVEELANANVQGYDNFKQLAINLMRLHNGDIREERQDLRATPDRQQHLETGTSGGFAGFSYSFKL